MAENNKFGLVCVKRIMRLLILSVLPMGTYAGEPQPADGLSAVDSVLAVFDRLADRAGGHAAESQQRQLAVRFFDCLNEEGFFDEPYRLPASWPIDSVRAEVWYCAGQYYFFSQAYARGIACCNKALPLLQQGHDREKAADCMSYLSSCYFRVSDYTHAIKYAEEVLAFDKETGDKSTISADLNNMAAIYLAAKRPEEALPYALEAIKNSTAAGDSLRMAIQMGMASEIYQNLQDNPTALQYATKAYEIDLRQGRSGKAAIRLCQMAAPLMAMERYGEAEKHLLDAVPMLEKAGNRQSYSIANNQLGQIALARKQERKAAGYFGKALPFLMEQGDYFNESKSREGLYQALKQADPMQAMRHLERFCMLQDSIYQRQMQEAISEHNAQYKNEELRLQLQYESKLKNTVVWISIPIVLIAIGIIVLLLYINRQRRQKQLILKQAEQTRTNFFTNITHEFRTPLTIIQSAAREIQRQSPENSDLCRHASDILRHGQGLLNLINQILDIAKISSSSPQASGWRHGDIVEFMGMLCESYSSYATGRGVELRYVPQQEHVMMDFNPDYLQKTVQNLISNAIKFSKPDSKVVVVSRIKGDAFRIEVRDTGIGMTEQQQAHIFEPFYQASDDTRNIGTGIGLSLAKLAVEGMKGKIEVHSIPEKGSVFTVTLPLTQAGMVPVPLKDAPSVGFEAPEASMPESTALPDDDVVDEEAVRVLVVEDNGEVARYIARQLKSGYHCYFAADGHEGLQKAEQLVPDIIISDVMMPGMDGFEMCRRVRASELLNHIPLVMVTAKATHQDRLHGLEAGADAYLEKPFHADELNVRVEKLLEQRRLLRQKYSQAMEEGREPDNATVSGVSRAFLAKATEAIQNAMEAGNNIDYDNLAYTLCLSRAQLNRKIKAITGHTTTEFILQIRIKRAKQLLDTTDMPIWEVAFKCGMDNDSYFCTLFKKATGQTPQQYRNRQA